MAKLPCSGMHMTIVKTFDRFRRKEVPQGEHADKKKEAWRRSDKVEKSCHVGNEREYQSKEKGSEGEEDKCR